MSTAWDNAPALMCFRSETTEEAFNGIVEIVASSIRASQFYSPAYKKIDPDTFCQDISDEEIGVATESAASAILTVEI